MREAAAMIDAALVAYPGSAQAHRAKAAALAAEPSDRYRRQVQDRMRAECAELERCTRARGSAKLGLEAFMEKGVGGQRG